jgi:hypothetical protein
MSERIITKRVKAISKKYRDIFHADYKSSCLRPYAVGMATSYRLDD